MLRYFAGVSAAALMTAAPIAALAQEQDPIRVGEIISTGTLQLEGTSIDKIGGSITVIGAEDIEARQVRFISDVLRDVPGVAVSRLGAPGGLTQVRIRGAESNHTLTLIDGIEANDPLQGEFEYASLIADEGARIEILRGQQSALYGSDAIAGVIHYITASGRDRPGLSARAEGGSFNSFNTALRVGGYEGDLDWAFSTAIQHTGGYPTQTDGLGKRDVGADNRTLGGKLNLKATDAIRLRGVARLNRTQADTNDAPFAQGSLVLDSPGVGYESQSFYYLAGADLEAMEGRWTHTLQIQGVDADRDTLAGAVLASRNQSTRIKGAYVTTLHFEGAAVSQHVTGAIDGEHETFKSGLNGQDRQADNIGYVLDYGAEFGEGTGIGVSVRQDENDLFQNATTYRLQAYHTIADRVRIRAAGGSGIKNPTFFELFGFGSTFVGNPQLKPEISKGWEVGSDLILNDDKVRLGFTYFDSQLENEIFSYFGGTLPAACPAPGAGNNTACNRTTTSTQQGVELYGHADLSAGFSIDASYTYLDAHEDGVEEIRRPPSIGSVNLGWRSPGRAFGANLTVRYQGKSQDSNFSILTPDLFPNDPAFTELPSPPYPFGRVALPAFTLVNLDADWKVNDRVELYGRVENLLDEDYYEVITQRTPGAAVYLGVRGRF